MTTAIINYLSKSTSRQMTTTLADEITESIEDRAARRALYFELTTPAFNAYAEARRALVNEMILYNIESAQELNHSSVASWSEFKNELESGEFTPLDPRITPMIELYINQVG